MVIKIPSTCEKFASGKNSINISYTLFDMTPMACHTFKVSHVISYQDLVILRTELAFHSHMIYIWIYFQIVSFHYSKVVLLEMGFYKIPTRGNIIPKSYFLLIHFFLQLTYLMQTYKRVKSGVNFIINDVSNEYSCMQIPASN